MLTLTDAELRMVAEAVTELARSGGTAFDRVAKDNAFARAALIDPARKNPPDRPFSRGERSGLH